MTKHFGLDRETLRLCITLGWQLGQYEFPYGSGFPEDRSVRAIVIATEIERLLEQGGFPKHMAELSFRDLMDSVARYSTTSSGKHAAIMIGIVAMRASLVGVLKDEESNREIERIAYRPLADVDPILLPDKINLFSVLLECKPRTVVDVIQFVDNLSGIRRKEI